ncbi:PEPxxWA-CTERM sorting domain-containing protein [Sphingomonas sp.]|uniref:PEPxxWA-CTERM sorting domain-containing protein n=1 Tax=Sphingomonas sp. TaxID=28214 RepID=UPI002DE8B5E0|nr:PEPxxWA-CTERM sorting domain-containing protein [Sphingomonas sp.]
MRIAVLACAASLSLGLGSTLPAQAAVTLMPVTFDFTNGNNSNVQDGNARFYSATSPVWGVFNLRVTAWSLETNAMGVFVRDSKLMAYSGGLGVISGDDGDGSQNRHSIDNNGRKDFILLQFNRQVRLTSATFNTYSVMGSGRDSDATIRHGTTALPWNQPFAIDNKPVAQLNALFTGSWSSPVSTSGNSIRNPNPQLKSGNLWLIGADFTNSDRRIDGFKLASITVIPEPATWSMMIGGFALAGTALRRRTVRVLA